MYTILILGVTALALLAGFGSLLAQYAASISDKHNELERR